MTQCPQCRQPLLDPNDRFCPHCGADLRGPGAPPPDARAGLPPEAPPAGLPPGDWTPAALPPGAPGPSGRTPWERRGQIGIGAALIETVQQVLTKPGAFFRSMPVTGGIGGPLLFGVIVGYVGLVASAIYYAVLESVGGAAWTGWAGRSRELERLLPYLQGGMGLVGQIVFGAFAVVIGLFVFSAIVHLMLLLVGGARQGFEATFRVAAYAEATMLLRLIPFCGEPIAVVYFLVVAIIGLAEAHRIGKGKSALAVLLPMIVFCCCCALATAVALGGLASVLGQAR
jgi:hypothetical protein